MARKVMSYVKIPKARALALAALMAATACGGAERPVGPIDDDEAETHPATIELRVSPQRLWYQTDQTVRLAATVEDREGRILGDAAVAWVVEPAGAATSSGAHAAIPGTADFELHREGRVVITACIAGDDGAATELCDSVALRVDDGSPSLEISEPLPGAELDDPDGIMVRGSVADASDARVYVLGQHVEVDELGQFETLVSALPGVNHLDVAASDGLTPEAVVELDVLWAPAYLAANAAPDAPLVLPEGLALSLGQRLFDGGGSFEEFRADDLAGLIGLIASHLPIDELIPSPIIDEETFRLDIPGASLGPTEVSLGVTSSGLDLFVRFPELALTTEGFIQLDETTLDLDGVVTASVAAAALIDVRGGGGEPVTIEVTDPWVAVESAQGEFASPETGAIFRLAESLFRSMIEEQIEGAVGGIVEDTLPALLGEALAVLEDLLGEQELELDLEILPAPITLSIGGELGPFVATQATDIAAGLETRLGVQSEILHPDTRGVALFDPGLEPPRFVRDGELQIGVRLSLVNGVLHALWSAGLLELDLAELLPDALANLLQGGWVSGRLPPVVRAPRLGEPGAVVLALGQVELELDLGPDGTARFGASLEASIDLAVDDQTVGIEVPGGPRLRVWTIDPAPGTVFTAELVEATLRDQFDTLIGQLLGPLALELPALAVGESLADIAPDLADLKLEVRIDETVRVRGDYLMIGAGLRGGLEALAAPVVARLLAP
jgi:hypothetical protein